MRVVRIKVMDSSRGGEKWVEFRYILRIGLIRFFDRLFVGREGEREIKREGVGEKERERKREVLRMILRFLV